MSNLCHLRDETLVHLLKDVFGSNNSNWNDALDDSRNGDCNGSSVNHTSGTAHHPMLTDFGTSPQYGLDMYAYLTPIIIIVGLLGNGISLKVFMRKSLRRLSACLYLSAISFTDSLVLLTYVLLTWLASDSGMRRWPPGHHLPLIHVQGVCQTFVFFSYVFRFVSVWLIVVFTIERYIAACRPLQRRLICTKSFGRKAIAIVVSLATFLSVFKPILSGIYDVSKSPASKPGGLMEDELSTKLCSRHPDHDRLVLAYELIYGLLITAVPFITIAVFNLLIIHRLVRRDATLKKLKVMFKDCRIRWEFTITLLVVSTCFICLNLPYFVVWIHQFVGTLNPADDPIKDVVDKQSRKNTLYVTRTVYYLNYCVNFFLYCVTGRYYRGELKSLLLCQDSSPNDKQRGFNSTVTRSTNTSGSCSTVAREANVLLPREGSKGPSNDITAMPNIVREQCSMLWIWPACFVKLSLNTHPYLDCFFCVKYFPFLPHV